MATIAVFLALGGGAYAALKLPKNSVGSKQLKKNAVRSAKVKNRSLLAKDFKPGEVPPGARGLQGARGPRGFRGVPATRLWVTVSTTGTIVNRSSPAIRIVDLGSSTTNGDYYVDFGRDVSACAATATLSVQPGGGTPLPGEIVLSRPDSHAVFVDVRTSTGASSAGGRGFALAIFC
jgi:hypothetical protein